MMIRQRGRVLVFLVFLSVGVFLTACITGEVYQEGYTIEGRVEDTSGMGCPNVELMIQGRTSTKVQTDAQGRFRVFVEGNVFIRPLGESIYVPAEHFITKETMDPVFLLKTRVISAGTPRVRIQTEELLLGNLTLLRVRLQEVWGVSGVAGFSLLVDKNKGVVTGLGEDAYVASTHATLSLVLVDSSHKVLGEAIIFVGEYEEEIYLDAPSFTYVEGFSVKKKTEAFPYLASGVISNRVYQEEEIPLTLLSATHRETLPESYIVINQSAVDMEYAFFDKVQFTALLNQQLAEVGFVYDALHLYIKLPGLETLTDAKTGETLSQQEQQEVLGALKTLYDKENPEGRSLARSYARVSVEVLPVGPSYIFRVWVHSVTNVEGAEGFSLLTPSEGFAYFGEEFTRATIETEVPIFILRSSTYSVSGYILDGDNVGIPFVTVSFDQDSSFVTTDLSGFWSKTGLTGSVTITPSKSGYTFSPATRQASAASTQMDFLGAIESHPASLSGTVQVSHTWPRSALQPRSDERLAFSKRSFSQAEEAFVPNQLLVGFVAGIGKSSKEALASQYDLQKKQEIEELQVVLYEFSLEQDLFFVLAELEKSPLVAYAEPNYIRSTTSLTIPYDQHYHLQWHYPQIRLPQAWSTTTGSYSIRVAVLDTGIKMDHLDLSSNLDRENAYCFITNSRAVYDADGHGTHVAGTIGAVTNNGVGVAGVMWQVAILPVKVLNDEGRGTDFGIAQGILYSAGLLTNPLNPSPVQVINLSLGGEGSSNTMQEAVERAYNAGVILVAAAGNSNKNMSNFIPASYPEVIAVGAVNYGFPHAPTRAWYSNYGSGLDVVAPGGDIRADTDGDGYVDGVLSLGIDGPYPFLEGTSMAAPHVAGVIGLMLSQGIPANQIRGILRSTAFDLGSPGFDSFFGHGLVNAYWAVNAVSAMRIVVGNRVGTTIHAVAETTINLTGGAYSVSQVPVGTYQVYAWIDVRGNNIIEPGDYFVELSNGPMEFHSGQSYALSGTIGEITE